MIVDEAEGPISYRPIEIESEESNCFSRILTEINTNNGLKLFSRALLNFSLNKVACIELSVTNLQLFTRVPALSVFSSF